MSPRVLVFFPVFRVCFHSFWSLTVTVATKLLSFALFFCIWLWDQGQEYFRLASDRKKQNKIRAVRGEAERNSNGTAQIVVSHFLKDSIKTCSLIRDSVFSPDLTWQLLYNRSLAEDSYLWRIAGLEFSSRRTPHSPQEL